MPLLMGKLKTLLKEAQPPLERQRTVLMPLLMGKLKALLKEAQLPLERQRMVLMPLLMGKLKILLNKEHMDKRLTRQVDSLMENRYKPHKKDHTNFMHMVTLVLLPPKNLSESKEILNSLTFMI